MASKLPLVGGMLVLFALWLSPAANAQTFVNLNINQPPELLANAGADMMICPGDSVQLGGSPTADGGTPGYTYDWTPAGVISNPTNANPLAQPAITTIFSVLISDANGCTTTNVVTITVDTCVGIADPTIGLAMDVFPNPNDGHFTVQLNGEYNGPATIMIIEPSGRVVSEQSVQQVQGEFRKEFMLNHVSKGIYLIQVNLKEGQLVRRMIVQ